MFEKMIGLFTGTGRNVEMAHNEPSHIHIQRPSQVARLVAEPEGEAEERVLQPAGREEAAR